VLFATEGNDDAHHREALMDDRERVPFEHLNFLETRLDVIRVIANGIIEERNNGEGSEGQGPVNPQGDSKHSDESEDTLGDHRNGHDNGGGCIALAIDHVDEHSGTPAIVEGDGHALRVKKELAAKIEGKVLIDASVHVLTEDVKPIDEERNEKAAHNDDQEHTGLTGGDGAKDLSEPRRKRRLAEDVINDDFHGPGSEDSKEGRNNDDRG
jgi:hypothetical protein